MLDQFKDGWRQLRRSSPGRRFHEYYRRRQGEGRAGRRTLWLVIGVAMSIAGAVLLVIPGPGIPVLALGLAAIARESLRMARSLDAAEVRIRRLVGAARRLWSRSPGWAKAVVVVAAALVVGAAAVGVYQVTLGG